MVIGVDNSSYSWPTRFAMDVSFQGIMAIGGREIGSKDLFMLAEDMIGVVMGRERLDLLTDTTLALK